MEPQPTPKSVMDIVPPPAQEQVATAPPEQAADKAEATPATPDKQPEKPSLPKPKREGVTAAIFATVIIVLGLAALATYAYLKQAK